jgi:HAD superfamily hydrolase (TIGR01509 family)
VLTATDEVHARAWQQAFDAFLRARDGERKHAIVERLLDTEGVKPYPGSIRFVAEAGRLGLRSAVVSSSANARRVLRAARIDGLFDAVVDGDPAERRALAGKPAPDTFLEGARLLGVDASGAAVFEDALASVAAGRAGRFRCAAARISRKIPAQEATLTVRPDQSLHLPRPELSPNKPE